jgi:hypothetical protein
MTRPGDGDFDATVRSALAQAGAATHPAPDLADRVLANARAGRPAVVSLAARRRAARWSMPLLGAAAVAVVAVGLAVTSSLVAQDHHSPAQRSTAPVPPSPTPSTAAVSSPSTAATSPTSTGKSAVAPGVVPAGFHAASISFRDDAHGWALGDGRCAPGDSGGSGSPGGGFDCAALLATANAGRTWHAVALPPGLTSTFDYRSCGDNGGIFGPCVNQVAFANARDGYLWGLHEFFWTSDGGRHWARETQPVSNSPGNTQMAFVGTTAVRFSPVEECSAECPGVVETAPVGTANWRLATPPGSHPGLYTSGLSASGNSIVLAAGQSNETVAVGIFRSADGGRTWSTAVRHPCGESSSGASSDPFFGGRLAANGDLIAICYATKHMGIRVAPAGTTVFSAFRPLPVSDVVSVVEARTGQAVVVWVPSDAQHPRPESTLYSTQDGGRSWTTLPTLRTPHRPLWSATSTDSASVLNADGSGLLVTSDGGRTWKPLPFR